jgi:RNA polymerase sigma factor (sigma-70 family)
MTSPAQPDDRHEALFITDFYPGLGAYLARQHANAYDAVAGRARFVLWLGMHADDGDGALMDYAARAVQLARLTAEEEAELSGRIQAGRRAEEKLAEGGDALSRQARANLEQAARDGAEAGNRLIETNLWQVAAIAERFTDRGVPFTDLVQAGNLGLTRAVQGYDHAKHYRFATFATWWIRQAITRSLADRRSRAAQPTEPGAGRIDELAQAERLMSLDLGREPTPEELAAELELPSSAAPQSPHRPSRDQDQ